MPERAAADSPTPVAARQGPPHAPGRLATFRAFLRLPVGLMWQRARHRTLTPLRRTAVYRKTLGQAEAAALKCYPHDPWPGNTARAQALLRHRYPFAGEVLESAAPPWHAPEATPAWRAELHGFAWLRDLRQLNTDAARRRARDLVENWMVEHPGPRGRAWEPAVTGARLASWLGQYGFFADTADADFRARLADSMMRQTRYLMRVLPCGLSGAEHLCAIKGLLYAGLCLQGGDPARRQGIALLERSLPEQIHPDGGHVTRAPDVQLRVLRDLLDLRATFAGAGLNAPRSIAFAIESMTPTLKLLRHGDGGLALFNGSDEGDRDSIDLALRRAALKTRVRGAAPQTGFQRLVAGDTCILVDAGPPPPPGEDARAHAGTLSFEMSEGTQRIVTNCGAKPAGTAWAEVARTTAAHSTVTVDETNSAELLTAGGLGRRPASVMCRRDEADGAVLLDMSHDGYARSHDVRHARRLYLDAAGGDLRGEDVVTGPEGLAVTLRFHLHPDVRAGLVQNGTAVHIRTPDSSGWRFQVAGASLDLGESVYLGEPERMRRSQQIVLATRTNPHRTIVKWALKREGV
jgi:uncharacterized heparinase superfamily protein